MVESATSLVGEVIEDRYRVRRLIGRGGMGAVYEAEAIRLHRLCAIKVLLAEYTSSETATRRFRREAQIAAMVKHPHVVEIFDTGTTIQGYGYIAMELLKGESLDRTLRREGRLPWSRVRHLALQICRALAAAHAQSVVHRDMKPENCFRTTQDRDPDYLKILDFGIAKLTNDKDDRSGRLTASNAVVGTYAYMAYEQVTGMRCDHRVDIWAVGVMLYEMLTGYLPFKGENQGQIWTAITGHSPAPMADLTPEGAIPPGLEEVVARALNKSRDERFPDMESLARALCEVDGDVITAFGSAAEVPPLGEHDESPRFFLPGTTDASARDVSVEPADLIAPAANVEASAELLAERSGYSPGAFSTSDALTIPSARPRRRPWLLSAAAAAAVGLGGLAWGIQEVGQSPRASVEGTGAADVAERKIPPSEGVAPMEPTSGPIAAATSSSPGAEEAEEAGTKVLATAEAGTEAGTKAPEEAGTKAPATAEAPARASKPSAKRVRSVTVEESYDTKVRRALTRLRGSGGIDRCITQHHVEGQTIEVDVEVESRSGKALRVGFDGLLRGSALARCIDREIRGWSLPESDEDNTTIRVTLSKAP